MMAAGGDVPANIKRWKDQFTGGDAAAQKTEEMKLGKWNVHIVDVSGSYAERMGGGPFAGGKVVNREDYAMAGAILVNPEGKKYFVKMIGPSKVVKANREAFVKMIKSIQQVALASVLLRSLSQDARNHEHSELSGTSRHRS